MTDLHDMNLVIESWCEKLRQNDVGWDVNVEQEGEMYLVEAKIYPIPIVRDLHLTFLARGRHPVELRKNMDHMLDELRKALEAAHG